MAILNKILNILIFLVAIAACVFSVLLFNRRVELRNRADELAKTVTFVVDTLDRDNNTKYTDNINSDNLGWKSYHEAKDEEGNYKKWEDNLNLVQTQVQDIYKHDKFMAEQYLEIGTILEYPGTDSDSKKESLKYEFRSVNLPDSYKGKVKELISHVEAVHKRENGIIQGLIKTSRIIKKEISLKSIKDLENYNTPIETLIKNIVNLQNKGNDFANGLADVKNKLGEFNGFTYDPEAFKKEDKEAYGSSLANLYADLGIINKKLVELRQTKKTLVTQTEELAFKTAAFEEVSEKLKNALNVRDKLIITNKKLTDDNKKLLTIVDNSKPGGSGLTPSHFTANIISTNENWDFVILDKGETAKLSPNSTLLVHRNNKFVCKILVRRVLPNTAVAEVINVTPNLKLNMPKIGDTVIVQ